MYNMITITQEDYLTADLKLFHRLCPNDPEPALCRLAYTVLKRLKQKCKDILPYTDNTPSYYVGSGWLLHLYEAERNITNERFDLACNNISETLRKTAKSDGSYHSGIICNILDVLRNAAKEL